jgi:membrane protein DedA with SNARE-associated domain
MNEPLGGARRRRHADVASGTTLAFCQGWVLLSAALVPSLLTSRPVVLEFLNGSLLAVAAAGTFVRAGHASVAVALTAPLALWLPVDAVSWWAGRRFGVGVAEWLAGHHPGRATIVAHCERLIDKFGPLSVILGPILPLPTALIFAATGWRRMPLALFILADAVGVMARGSVAFATGYFYGNHGIDIARRFAEYSALVSGIIIVAVIVIMVIRVRSMMRERMRGREREDANLADD